MRHDEFARVVQAFLHYHVCHFRDDISGAAHDDGVADAHVFAADFILVVQRGIGHGHAADEYRRKPRHRGQRAGTPDLHLDAQQHGHRLLGGKLVRDGPARRA